MIRKSIIAVLLTCTVATGALWAVSYWLTPKWQIGDFSMRHNARYVTVSLAPGRCEILTERRSEWTAGPFQFNPYYYRLSPTLRLPWTIQHNLGPANRCRFPDAYDALPPKDSTGAERTQDTPFDTEVADVHEVPAMDSGGESRVSQSSDTTVTRIWFTAQTSMHGLWIPFWIPFLLFGIYPCVALTRAAVFRRRRRRNGLCPRCGYDLTGNISGVCPECGQGIAPLRREVREEDMHLDGQS